MQERFSQPDLCREELKTVAQSLGYRNILPPAKFQDHQLHFISPRVGFPRYHWIMSLKEGRLKQAKDLHVDLKLHERDLTTTGLDSRCSEIKRLITVLENTEPSAQSNQILNDLRSTLIFGLVNERHRAQRRKTFRAINRNGYVKKNVSLSKQLRSKLRYSQDTSE